ncbi:MAG: hypothetical protein M1828_005795 [Chrysothrix sp. TS-e1954]|nr:MAG: hypothetical protein M1828_005795 [Chrysothrix sp. TS-e1954]
MSLVLAVHLLEQPFHDKPLDTPQITIAPERLAYATFLSPAVAEEEALSTQHDLYYLSVRMLVYQILHADSTRSPLNLPVIVLVTHDVPEDQIQQLEKDGAQVVTVDAIEEGLEWMKEPGEPRWRDVLSKMRLWQQTQFDRILFLDADTALLRPLDDIFKDNSTLSIDTLGTQHPNFLPVPGDPTPPTSYVLASLPEVRPRIHHFPPTHQKHDFPFPDFLNAGFFVMRPSLEMFEYYMALARRPNRFSTNEPEQNLMNCAHRPKGRMPWVELSDTRWNVKEPNMEDWKGEVGSVHEKWWLVDVDEDERRVWYEQLQGNMTGFYEVEERDTHAQSEGG